VNRRLASTSEESIHLVDEHLERSVSVLYSVGARECVCRRQNTVGVYSRFAVETVPDHRRQVEQHRLLCVRNKHADKMKCNEKKFTAANAQ